MNTSSKNDFWMEAATDHPIITFGFRSIEELAATDRATVGNHIALTGGPRAGEVFRVAEPNTYIHNGVTVISLPASSAQAVSQTRRFQSMDHMLQDSRTMNEFQTGEHFIVDGVGLFEITTGSDSHYVTFGEVRLYDLQRRTATAANRIAGLPAGTVGFMDGIAYVSDPSAIGTMSATHDLGVNGVSFASADNTLQASSIGTTSVGVTVQDSLDFLYTKLDAPEGVVPVALGGTGAATPSGARNNIGAGDVTGPGTTTSGTLAVFDGTTGKLLRSGPNQTTVVLTSGDATIEGNKTFRLLSAYDQVNVVSNTVSRVNFRTTPAATPSASLNYNSVSGTFSMNIGTNSGYGLQINGTNGQISAVNGAKFVGDGSLLTNLPITVGVGVDQEYYSMISSRSLGTSFQNTTSKAIHVVVSATAPVGHTGAFEILVSSDNSNWVSVTGPYTGTTRVVLDVVVPINHYYRIPNTGWTLSSWTELR